jgi:hypothetical protein
MKKREDLLAQALAQLKREGLSSDVPQEVLDETLRRIADCGLRTGDSGPSPLPIRHPKSAIRSWSRLVAAAAVLVFGGYALGRLSAPRPPDLDQLREALAPSLAATLEPALRERLVEDLRQQYQLALAGTYVRVKEELTEQYRSDLNRFAVQTLAASNAVTNELLTQLIQSLDTAKAQDLRRIAQALYQMERNRVQDRTQLASGLQTLAYHTENELTATRRQVARFLGDVRLEGREGPAGQPKHMEEERSEP